MPGRSFSMLSDIMELQESFSATDSERVDYAMVDLNVLDITDLRDDEALTGDPEDRHVYIIADLWEETCWTEKFQERDSMVTLLEQDEENQSMLSSPSTKSVSRMRSAQQRRHEQDEENQSMLSSPSTKSVGRMRSAQQRRRAQ